MTHIRPTNGQLIRKIRTIPSVLPVRSGAVTTPRKVQKVRKKRVLVLKRFVRRSPPIGYRIGALKLSSSLYSQLVDHYGGPFMRVLAPEKDFALPLAALRNPLPAQLSAAHFMVGADNFIKAAAILGDVKKVQKYAAQGVQYVTKVTRGLPRYNSGAASGRSSNGQEFIGYYELIRSHPTEFVELAQRLFNLQRKQPVPEEEAFAPEKKTKRRGKSRASKKPRASRNGNDRRKGSNGNGASEQSN